MSLQEKLASGKFASPARSARSMGTDIRDGRGEPPPCSRARWTPPTSPTRKLGDAGLGSLVTSHILLQQGLDRYFR
jgi:hypothetical protein